MPLYEYLCPVCGNLFEKYFKLKDDSSQAGCDKCGAPASKAFIHPPSLHGDTGTYAHRRFPYYDESLDKTFTSLSEKKSYLKEKGIRIRERGERLTNNRVKTNPDPNVHLIQAENDKEFDRKVDEIVKKKIEQQRSKR